VHVAGFVALLRPCRNEDVGVLRPGKHLRSVPVPAAGSSAPWRAVKTVKRNFVSVFMYSTYRHALTLLDFRTDFGVSGSVFEPRRSLLCLLDCGGAKFLRRPARRNNWVFSSRQACAFGSLVCAHAHPACGASLSCPRRCVMSCPRRCVIGSFSASTMMTDRRDGEQTKWLHARSFASAREFAILPYAHRKTAD